MIVSPRQKGVNTGNRIRARRDQRGSTLRPIVIFLKRRKPLAGVKTNFFRRKPQSAADCRLEKCGERWQTRAVPRCQALDGKLLWRHAMTSTANLGSSL